MGIIHLHGMMGEYSIHPPKGRQYMAWIDPSMLKLAAEGIKIIHEGKPDDPEFDEARRKLREAKRVCFLGFGYDATNLSRLKPEDWRKTPVICGSSLGLTDLEMAKVRDAFDGRIVLSPKGFDCVGVLGNLIWLD